MKFVKSLVKEGVEKEEIFNRALEEGLDKKKVSRFLANIPDPDLSTKYNTANIILLGIYTALSLFGLLQVFVLVSDMPQAGIITLVGFSLLIPCLVIYSISKKQSIGYLILCFLTAKGMLNSLKVFSSRPDPIELIVVAIGLVISLALLIYVIILKKKLFPYQNFINSKKNGDGVFIFSKDLAL